jgi:hypothetical protein
LQLESGGGDLLPVLEDKDGNAEPEAEEVPASGRPGTKPPPGDPGDAAPEEEDIPWPGCGAVPPAEDFWLAVLTPAATALWERMDGSPWALCSLAVPAGLAMVVGSCGVDPSSWEEETDGPRSPLWRAWRRGGLA